MSAPDWQPGDVALVEVDGQTTRAMRQHPHGDGLWTVADRCKGGYDHYDSQHRATVVRPLVVIDPEDRTQVERLRDLMDEAWEAQNNDHGFIDVQTGKAARGNAMQSALRSFVDAPGPVEPTDPKVAVTDRRDNVWRRLADGDWVCTSGPDIGEYLNWDQLAGDRGPVEVSA